MHKRFPYNPKLFKSQKKNPTFWNSMEYSTQDYKIMKELISQWIPSDWSCSCIYRTLGSFTTSINNINRYISSLSYGQDKQKGFPLAHQTSELTVQGRGSTLFWSQRHPPVGEYWDALPWKDVSKDTRRESSQISDKIWVIHSFRRLM